MAFSIMGVAMIFGGPLLTTTLAQRLGRALCYLWLSGYGQCLRSSCLVESPCQYGLAVWASVLFSSLPSLITLYVVENTTAEDYGASFAAADIGVRRCPDHFTTHWRMDRGHDRFLYNGFSALCDNQLDRPCGSPAFTEHNRPLKKEQDSK